MGRGKRPPFFLSPSQRSPHALIFPLPSLRAPRVSFSQGATVGGLCGGERTFTARLACLGYWTVRVKARVLMNQFHLNEFFFVTYLATKTVVFSLSGKLSSFFFLEFCYRYD